MSYLLEDWERVDEVNLLSILVHINPFKFFISTLLIPYTFLFCHEHLFPKSTMFFPIEPRVQCRLRLIHIQSADAMLWVYRTVWETKTYSHRHRHNPSRAHRKRDIKKITVGSFFYCWQSFVNLYLWSKVIDPWIDQNDCQQFAVNTCCRSPFRCPRDNLWSRLH